MNGIEKLLNEDDVYLKKSKDTYCYQCGACDPLNSYEEDAIDKLFTELEEASNQTVVSQLIELTTATLIKNN